MKSIPTYNFYKTKYGEELLIDIVTLDGIKKYINQHPVHILTYYDITLITKGNGILSINGEQYYLSPGDIIFSKPGEVREWDKTKIPDGYALIFEEEFLLSFFNDPAFIQNLTYFSRKRTSAKINIIPIYPRIETLIGHIINEINNEYSKDKHILRALLYEILTLLNREYSKQHPSTEETPPNRYVDNFVILADQYFKVHHDIQHYADKLCITPNYLNELIRKVIGTSPKCYLQNKIIQEAKTLVAYTNLSVSEIADDLGFETSSYFIRMFRNKTGLTPLQYRKNLNH